jgi:MSHA biogenesis protein MshP
MNNTLNRGFALPAVIFLMVVVTLLLGYMARMVAASSSSSDLRLLGARAYWAAQAANEWAAYQVAQDSSSCPAAPAGFNINGFAISLTCTRTAYTDGVNSGAMFTIRSRAQSGTAPASLEYVSRTLEVTLDVY